jgi:hypothetical protein
MRRRVSVRRASSTTEPTSASISGARPASTSCSIDVLCLPTFSAPAMRLSSVTRNSMPSLCATACASRIIAAASSRVSGYWQMSTSVECDRLLIGLKVRLPHSFSQISERMLSSTGALKPALVKHADTRIDAIAARTIEFADREAIAFDVTNHTRRDQLGCRVHDAADDPLGRNLVGDCCRWGQRCAPAARQRAAMVVEVPEGNAVLHRHDHGLGSEELGQVVGHGLDLMRLHRQDHDVLRAGFS